MTIEMGKWRVRLSARRRLHGVAWFANRLRYPEGDVYRVSAGWLMFKAMVDCLPARERFLHEQHGRQFVGEQ